MITGTLTLLSLLWALQAPAADVVYMNSAAIKIPATVDEHLRSKITELQLYVSTNDGKPPWELQAKTTPDKPEFIFNAPHDGLYAFSVIAVDQYGGSNPPSPQPNLKILVDQKPPVVTLTARRGDPDTIAVRWTVSDENLDLPSLKLEYRTVDTVANKPTSEWTPVIVHTPAKEGEERITPNTGSAVEVQLTVFDLAKNTGSNVATVEAVPGPIGPPAPPPPPSGVTGGSHLPDPVPGPVGPPPGQLVSRQHDSRKDEVISPPPTPPPPPPPPPPSPLDRKMDGPPAWGGGEVGGGTGNSGSGLVSPVREGPGNINRVVAQTVGGPGAEVSPGGAGSGAPVSPQPPLVPRVPARGDLPPLQIVKTPQVVLEYKVKNSGVSGIKSVQVYLTQDNGQHWQAYDQPLPVEPAGPGDPKDGSPMTRSLKVKLPNQEGIYGLYLVVCSGAGLCKPPPVEGTPPQMRIELDWTAPDAVLLAPGPDPANPRDHVMFLWQATDRNLGPQPITLQWSEHKEGPWETIGEPALPNTGKYSWQLPHSLPPLVYLRLTVRDAAGNISVAETASPLPIDLNLPETDGVTVKVTPQ